MSVLGYSSLERAVAQLEKSVGFLNSREAERNSDLREQFRGAVIQAFECTYELAVKMIRRQLEQIVLNPSELREMAFMDLIRTAAEAGLVRKAPPFKVYREMRSITSHTYDPDRAEDVVGVVGDFLEDVHFLLDELRKRNREGD